MKVLQQFKINENGIEIADGTEINHICAQKKKEQK